MSGQHDRLCPCQPECGVGCRECRCGFIGEVRDRTLSEARAAVLGLWIELYPAEGWNGALDHAGKAIDRLMGGVEGVA